MADRTIYPSQRVKDAETHAAVRAAEADKALRETHLLAVMETVSGRFVVQAFCNEIARKRTEGTASLERANYERCADQLLRVFDRWLADVPAELRDRMRQETQ